MAIKLHPLIHCYLDTGTSSTRGVQFRSVNLLTNAHISSGVVIVGISVQWHPAMCQHVEHGTSVPRVKTRYTSGSCLIEMYLSIDRT